VYLAKRQPVKFQKFPAGLDGKSLPESVGVITKEL